MGYASIHVCAMIRRIQDCARPFGSGSQVQIPGERLFKAVEAFFVKSRCPVFLA